MNKLLTSIRAVLAVFILGISQFSTAAGGPGIELYDFKPNLKDKSALQQEVEKAFERLVRLFASFVLTSPRE